MIYKYLILLMFFLTPSRAMPAELGRLFFSPEQRAQLDLARIKRDQRPLLETNAAPNSATPAPRGPAVVTFNGAVQRGDGKSTVWINGNPVTERNRLRNEMEVSVIGMRRDGELALAIPQASRKASLKVGQSLDVTSGRIDEPYSRRATERPTTEVAPSAGAEPVPVAKPAIPARPRRPLRNSDLMASDPDSGAAAMERPAAK